MRILSNLSVSGLLGLNSVADANTDTDKFLVLDSSGIVRYRTGSEVFSDIGAGGAAAYTSVLQHTVKAGVALTKGQAVYVTGADGTNMIVGKASNASEATSSKTLGLIVQNLAINDQGFVITEGLLAGLDTSTAIAGDPVWLGTDGNLIFGLLNKPYAPAHLVFIGIVTRVQQNNGEIFVKVQNGFELQELHNVQITSTPADNTVLAYETSTSLYKMKSIPTLLGYTPVTNARNITINGTTYDLSADRSWSVGTHTGNLTTGYVPKATGATTLTDSLIYDNGSAIGINTASPYESSAFKLDVNGGVIIKNTSGTAAQLILINSNPATGGNNGFVQLSAGGNTSTAFGQWQTYYGMSVASGALRLQPAGGQVLIGTTTTSAFLTDINGTLRVSGQLTLGSTISNNTYVYTMPGASGTLALVSQIPSLSGYVPTSRTLTINGTSYDLSADRSWTIAAGVSAVQAGSGISVSTSSGVVTVVNTGLLSGTAGSGISVSTSGQNLNIVNTGLLSGTAGSGISVSTSGQNLNIVNTGLLSATAGSGISVSTTSQNVNIVNTGLLSATAGTGISVSTTSGTLNIVNTITNTNQLTNGAGYITGITSGMVTTALGYTPYNATNPNGYISSYTETDTLASVTGRGATTSTAITISGIDSALKVQHDGTSVAWRGRIGSFNASADKSSFLGNYTGRPGVFGHNNALSAWDDLWVNTLGIYGQGNTYLSWFTYVKGNGNDTNYPILHSANYNSYSPTLTGGGASGTWGINISGTAQYFANNYIGQADANTIWRAGSYTFFNGVNVPGGDFGLISFPTWSSTDSNSRYNIQLGANIGGNLRYRSTNINGAASWATMLSDANYTSYAVPISGYTFGTSFTLGTMYVGTGEQFTPTTLLGVYSNGYTYKFPVAGIQSWLGLGTMAYASTSSYVPYGNWGTTSALNDYKLYLRTNGDNNHYLWNAGDDWEELNAYEGTGFRITSVGGTVGVLYVYGSTNGGYTYSPYSFRAPIFYDSQNTGYYGDFSSTSNMYRLQLGGGAGGTYAGLTVQAVTGNTGPIVAKSLSYATTWSILPWSGGDTYISTGIYYDNGVWTHASDNTKNALFRLSPSGPTWYSSDNSAPSWNIASDVPLWSNVGRWINNVTAPNDVRAPQFRFTNSGNSAYFTGEASWGARIQTDSGYIWFGPANGSYAHIYTDRGQFYFNADILINGTSVVKNDGGTWSISISGNAGSATSAGSVSGLTLTSSANGINPDSVTQNQLGYNTSVNLFGQTDGGLYSSAYSSNWIHQIYGDFRTGQIAIRGKLSGTWQAWRVVLDSSNFSSYALPISGGTIATNGFIDFGPNSTWGSTLRVGGNGHGGTTRASVCTTNGNLHLDGGTTGGGGGVYLNAYHNGPIYATTSQHLVLHAGNIASYTAGNVNSISSAVGGSYNWTGINYFVSNRNTTSDSPPLQAYSNNGSGAIMSFHRGGYYAVNFGLDSDNVMRIGGWSAAANRWQLDMSGNMTNAGTITAGGDLSCNTLNTGNVINIGYARNGGESIATSSFRGIEFHSSGSGYYIGKPAGAWTQPLDIAFYTGIRHAANSGYNGHRWYNNTDFATITASINDGDNNMRGYYDIIAYASDRRLKENVKVIDNAIGKVKQLTGMTYTWNSLGNQYGWSPSNEREAGVFAQDVQAVLPEAVKLAPFDNNMGVSKSGENFLTVKYEKIVPLLIEAIKEQQTQIEELKSKLDAVTK